MQPAPSHQMVLDLGVKVEGEVNGIEMGVLDSGIPYLTQTGVAKLCGVSRSVIWDIAKEWEESLEDSISSGKDRISIIKNILADKGYKESKLYIEFYKKGSPYHAYPDIVCLSLLEYYVYESKIKTEAAQKNYRNLAGYGLQRFIFDSLGYKPLDKWAYFHDRVSLLKDACPLGYWSIFRETTGFVVDLISAGLPVNDKTIPDISVGKSWGPYWVNNNLEQQHGSRVVYTLNYPPYYPQAAANPHYPWAYPDLSLPIFKSWFIGEYLLTCLGQFPPF